MDAQTPPVNGFTQTALNPLVRAWWIVGLVGLGLVALGVLLLARLADTKSVLVWLVAIGLVMSGINEFVQANRLTRRWPAYVLGAIWIITGIWAVAWPGITLWALAVVTGIGLIAGGLSQVVFTLAYRREIPMWAVWVLDGLASMVIGVLALLWPRATVIVLAIVLGLRILFSGLATLWFAGSLRKLNKTYGLANV